MTHDWSLREEIIIATHRWPVIILFGLVGILLAWLISFIFPSQYRATKELYVGINIYTAAVVASPTGFSDPAFTNADDFKNWQMANLDSLVKMDENIDNTLHRLQEIDKYWNDVEPAKLSSMLHVYWRNAGKWRLVAEHEDPVRATQAVLVWEQVVVDRIHAAIEAAQNSIMIDLQFRSIIDLQNQLDAQIAGQSQIRDLLYSWQLKAAQWPAQQTVSQSKRLQIEDLLYQVNTNAAWAQIVAAFPPVQAPAQEYIPFLQTAISTLDQEILSLQSQTVTLEKKKNSTFEQLTGASANSLGLSANLVVDQVTGAPAELITVRPSGVLILVGGLLGLILWALVWTAKIVVKHRNNRGNYPE